MKTALNILIAIAFSFGSKTSQAQNTTKENTLLWEISGNGLSKPSYLFGTFHLICPDDYILREKVTKSLSISEQLVTEINLTDTTEMNALMNLSKAEVPLSKKLSVEKYKELEVGLKSQYNIELKQFDPFTIETIGSAINFSAFACQQYKFYEVELIKLAKKQHKAFLGLEKVADQKIVMKKAAGENYVFQLLKNKEPFLAAYKALIQYYKTEDLDKLNTLSRSSLMMDVESKKWMLTNRNYNWVKKLPAIMKEKSSFIAVGAAHLGGDDGLIQLLRQLGFAVTPIMN